MTITIAKYFLRNRQAKKHMGKEINFEINLNLDASDQGR